MVSPVGAAYVDSLFELKAPGRGLLGEEELVTLCSEVFVAGIDTSTSVLQWAFLELVLNQEIQEQLYREIVSTVGKNGLITEDHVEKMPYLNAVVKETLRIHSPAHFTLSHAATEETKLGGYEIPTNANVEFYIEWMTEDPNLWKDPGVFRPERFLEGDGVGVDLTGTKGTVKMLPFGAGRRTCPGLTLGMLHVNLMLARMVQAFKWLPNPNGLPDPTETFAFTVEGPVLDYICKALDLPHLFVADLIHFGAVHYALVCPQPPPTATPEQVRCYDIDWKSRIIAVTESYVVLDKPAGTSVGGTTDNIEESCATFATRALGLTTPLKTTHQIDNCTEGCVVLARTKEYCSVFHGKIRDKKVKKLYLALAASPVPTGVITHYMRPVNIAPRIVSEGNDLHQACIDNRKSVWNLSSCGRIYKGWHLCQLEVLECKKVPWPDAVTEEKYSIEDCGWPSKDYAYECKINLLTGRTHQIRAQLAAYGAPLVGDSMYMPAAIAEIANPGVNPFGKYKKQYVSQDDQSLATAEWVVQHGKEPNVAIGLQACQISWDDGKHIYKAGSPWWRCKPA
ncbi:hypothetical protein GH714_037257 [Hevea brasiliensis]|uniref:Pseudouridine synthase RsuA/RluA-like domain-containing protein n=1 Tax=Hevea brasiliensis TaxID=3981 RepID=A0A6A6LX94_HEVBR|nr:hypothetical protein GH714_037257 [Hevea brasiliensis]